MTMAGVEFASHPAGAGAGFPLPDLTTQHGDFIDELCRSSTVQRPSFHLERTSVDRFRAFCCPTTASHGRGQRSTFVLSPVIARQRRHLSPLCAQTRCNSRSNAAPRRTNRSRGVSPNLSDHVSSWCPTTKTHKNSKIK